MPMRGISPDHVCKRCKAGCCRPGLVSKGIELLPHEHETRKAAGERGLLQESGKHIRLNGEICAALKEGECSLHEVKPERCKVYPFVQLRPDLPILEAVTACPAIEDHIRRNPESLVTIQGRLFLTMPEIQRDNFLGESLDHALKHGGISPRIPLVAITSVGEEWFDDPVISKRLKALGAQGVKFKKE